MFAEAAVYLGYARAAVLKSLPRGSVSSERQSLSQRYPRVASLVQTTVAYPLAKLQHMTVVPRRKARRIEAIIRVIRWVAG